LDSISHKEKIIINEAYFFHTFFA